MENNKRLFLQAALRIHAGLQRHRTKPVVWQLPESSWDDCRQLTRQLARAQAKGWQCAADVLRLRLKRAVQDCALALHDVHHHLGTASRPPITAGPHLIFEELLGLSEEFDGVSVDLAKATVTVVTEPIELEGIDLGPFEIRLCWNDLGDRRPYATVAIDPNPARSSTDTTHPHVQGEELCEGEGRASIRQALLDGRILDFFQIVNRVLKTYNAGSAYVSLEEWEGRPCADCDHIVCPDDEYSCDRCGNSLCEECVRTCQTCHGSCCPSCLDACGECGREVCSSCQRQCDRCDRVHCASCSPSTNLCQECNHDPEQEPGDGPCVSPNQAPASQPAPEGVPV